MDRAGLDMVAVAAHPGWSETNLQRHAGLFDFMNRFVAQEAAMGALPTLYAATAPDVRGGDYYGPDGFMERAGHPKKVSSNGRSRDEEVAERLWRVSQDLTGVTYP
jgi:hypothetical protein